MKSIVTIQSKSDLFGNEENKKKAREVFGKFLFEGELSILFGDSGTGKSILANDIAFFVSGGGHEWDDMESPNIPSLYIDLEMTKSKFTGRYKTAIPYIPDTYSRGTIEMAEIKDTDDIFNEIKNLIVSSQAEKNAPKFIIVDNLSNGFGSVMNASRMKKVVFEFKKLKDKYDLTILLIAHTKKRQEWAPITKDDIIGSSMIFDFVDSAFAIGQSRCGKQFKYIKQIKTREDTGLVDVMSVMLENEPFLHYKYLGYNGEHGHLNGSLELVEKEPLSPQKEAILTNMLMKNEHTYSEIADFLEISRDEVINFAIENRL